MSEYLKSKEHKQQILKKLITDLHNGRDFDEVKREFNELVEGVDAVEIANMEQQLIEEGMPPEQIKKLCDVHAAIFKDALAKNEQSELVPGHPLYSLKHENNAARKVLAEIEEQINKIPGLKEDAQQLDSVINSLKDRVGFFRENLDKHYSKKENIIFPYLERHNITGPPSVMWSVDDEIRDMIKGLSGLFDETKNNVNQIPDSFIKVKEKVTEMFSKEEDILTPMLRNTLTEEEWAEIKEQETEFGIVFSKPDHDFWQPEQVTGKPTGAALNKDNAIELDTGALTPKQINELLTNLPVDITFVDANDEVRYFSQTKERIFTRTKSIIGRKVQNCHPPESVHVVEKIVNDFKSGKHNTAEFWLELGGHFIYIQYLALRDEEGNYTGTIEVSQDITKLRSLEGERRLLKYTDE